MNSSSQKNTCISVFKRFSHDLQDYESLNRVREQFTKAYALERYKIDGLSSQEAFAIFQRIVARFYHKDTYLERNLWYENQLRVYVWILSQYCHISKRQLEELTVDDFKYFSLIFNNRPFEIFQFQIKHFIIKTFPKWNKNQQSFIVQVIKSIQQKHQKQSFRNSQWNTVAKQLYILSQRKCFRTARQCREHWVNYLDPNKLKNVPWMPQQDVVLLGYIKIHEKKQWSQISKILGHKRSDHDVKNRFRVICSTRIKASTYDLSQSDVMARSLTMLRKKTKRFDQIMEYLQDQNSVSKIVKIIETKKKNQSFGEFDEKYSFQEQQQQKYQMKPQQINIKIEESPKIEGLKVAGYKHIITQVSGEAYS